MSPTHVRVRSRGGCVKWTLLTQDPIGLAGGVNLYAYAGNSPITYWDPFGLKVCYAGSGSEVTALKEGTEQATGSTLSLDENNCVAKVVSNGDKKFDKIRNRFQSQVNSKDRYTVQFDTTGSHWTSWYDDNSLTANILPGDIGGFFYNTGHWYAPCALTGGIYDTPQSLPGLIAHELIGHGADGPNGQGTAIKWENEYHRAVGDPARCGGK